jgi:hypothetical protein
LLLLIAKILEPVDEFNGAIYILLFGYPLIVILSIIYYNKVSQDYIITNSSFNDSNEILIRLRYFKILIDSFLSRNKNSKNDKSSSGKKYEILLMGFIMIHESTCTIDDCPLKKFLENPGNYQVQKMTLLHYMNTLFNEGIKKFPNNKMIIMDFVEFNYEKKYNLNSAKLYLAKLEKSQNTIIEDFIIYNIKQNISIMNNSKANRGMNEDEEVMKVEDSSEHKFKRCIMK